MDILTPATDWAKPETDPHHDELSLLQKIAVFLGVVVPFLGLIGCIFLFWNHGIYPVDLWLLASMYSLTVIGVTVGFHRLFTHRSFETVPIIRFFLAVFGSMSLQGPIIKWCAVHRRHHQVSDRDGDPHSPHAYGDGLLALIKGAWHSHVGWIFHPDPPEIRRSVSDLVNDPMILFVDKWFFVWVVLGVLIPTLIGAWIMHGWMGALHGFLWGGLVRLCLMHHATWSINSVCHIWGTKPFHSNDESRNNVIFGIVSFGEGWHNNHHAFPTSARHGLRWYQLDISYLFILALKWTKLARNLRLPNKAALKAKARVEKMVEHAADSVGRTPNTGMG